MQEQRDIIDCYDKTANNYADKFIDELTKKHLDRILLKSFAAENFNKGKLIDLGCGPGQTTKYLSECGLTEIGFEIIDAIERQPYKDAEHPSRRAYIWAKTTTAG